MSEDKCLLCDADLQGEPIPKKSRDKGYYGDKTHFSRRIGISDPRLDRIVEWLCPDCGGRWNRGDTE